MHLVSARHAGRHLDQLLDAAAESHEPIHITGQRAKGVLVSEDDWRAMQETLHLLSIPGMRESIREGLASSVEDCLSSREGSYYFFLGLE